MGKIEKSIGKTTFVLLIVVVIGCKEGRHSPTFSSELLGYFPYSEGDALKFINTNNDTLILNISEHFVSDSYTQEPGSKALCEAEANFRTSDTNQY